MKKANNLNWLIVAFFISLVLSVSILAKHETITEHLITIVEHDTQLKTMLVKAIAQAKEINPDRQTNPAQTLEEYYAFIDWAAKAMPWSILPDQKYPKLYDQIDQSLDYFYFVSDQPLSELAHKGYYHNSLQYHEPYRSWMINFTKEWGQYLSTEVSWNDAYYKKALDDKRFGLTKGWYEDPSRWKSFNDFFARYLRSPAERPIASPGDPSVIVSPADSTPQGVWKIDGDSNIVSDSGIPIKSNIFSSVKVLIGEGSAYADAFSGGTLTHTFLDVNDYHRYHFPVSGTVKEVRIIPSDDAVGGITKWDPKRKRYILESKTPGWQNIETRGCVIIDTEKYGLVALLPIGMSQVSSVNFEASVKVGKRFKKGEMLGYFLFGGSDYVILFQDSVDFTLTVPGNKKEGFAHILMGEAFGKVRLKK